MSGSSTTSRFRARARRAGAGRAGAGGAGPPAPGALGSAREASPSRRVQATVLAACLALAALSLVAPSTPSYDPWAWLVWGREVAALGLDTRFGPSWKPLPVLFTTPFSVFGEAAPALWLVVARAGALLGLAAAFGLGRRIAGPFGGVLAAVFLALAGGYLRGAALGYSEGLLVAFALLAADRHLEGRRGQALALGFLAGLLRPEAWPFLGLYALYVFAREPRRRLLVAALMALLPVLWLGPELWGSGDALRAASRAQDPTLLSPAFADRPWLAVLDRATTMTAWPARLGALAAIGLALAALLPRGERRRGRVGLAGAANGGHGRRRLTEGADRAAARTVLALAAGGATWLALVAAMTELGYAGNSRYLAMPVAVAAVVGGAGVGWLAHIAALDLERVFRRMPLRRGAGARAARRASARRAALAPALATALVGLACLALLRHPIAELAGDAREVREEARLNADFPAVLARAGGRARVLGCGRPYATALQVPAVAWYLRVATGRVGIEPAAPGVLFRGPPRLQPPDAPAPAPTAGGLRPVARLGGWTVSSSC